MRTRLVSAICLAVAIGGSAGAAYLGWRFTTERRGMVETARQESREAARACARDIGERVTRLSDAMETLAGELSSGTVSTAEAAARLKAVLAEFPALRRAGIVPAAGSGAYQAMYFAEAAASGLIRREPLPDYTSEAWYVAAREGRRGWTDDGLYVTYSVPLREPAGVLFASATLEDAAATFDIFGATAAGWGGLVSRQGYFLVHPDQRLVRQRINVEQLLKERNDPEFAAAVRKALAGEPVFVETTESRTGETSWLITEPVPATGWTVFTVRIVNEILPAGRDYRRAIINITSLALAGSLAILFWLAGFLYLRTRRESLVWLIVVLASGLLIAGTSVVRKVTFNQVSEEDVAAVPIQDQPTLASFVQSRIRTGGARQVVPTGIYIQSIKFSSIREITATGFIWQKFPAGAEVPEEPQFLLPDAYDPTIKPIYRRREGNSLAVGWEFESVIRQKFDVSRYPFDHDNLSIRLWPSDLGEHSMLVPDLAAYPFTNPSSLPGLKQNLDIGGWTISGSFFDYQFREYNTDFGLTSRRGQQAGPQLRFNIAVKRNLLDPAIQNLIPILVILAMLFAVVLSATSDSEKSKMLGFNPAGTMRIVSALFFVTLVAHIQLRNSLQSPQLVFLEASYFLVYVVLLLTALHDFVFLLDNLNVPIVKYENSLICKMLFWPAILAAQFTIAVGFFY